MFTTIFFRFYSNRETKSTMAISVVTIILCLAWTQTNGVVLVEKINSNGLMFREMGHAYSYERNWKIITIITKEKFEEEEKFIKNRIIDLRNLQNKYQNKNIGIVLHEFERLSDIIKEINSVITYEQPTRHNRWLLPFLGSFAEWAIGNPDEDTLKEIISQIEENRKHQQFSDIIVRNHTMFIGRLMEAIEKRIQ